MDWEQALAWAEGLTYAGKSDWRLPNAKELQSIVDYGRCPDATHSAAIDPLFSISSIRDEGGRRDYPFFWTSTTHASLRGGAAAVYIAFGESPGWMRDRRTGELRLLDVHGAGSQRSDPKRGAAADFPHGRGPQGDVIRIANFARCVRGGVATPRPDGPPVGANAEPEPERPGERWVRRLDRDGDGRVSRAEFDGPAAHFGDFDRNEDGYIDASEAPSGPPRRR